MERKPMLIEIDESDSLVNSIPLPPCRGCTMVKNEWPGEGYTHEGETSSCQRGAEGTSCMCVAVGKPGLPRPGQKLTRAEPRPGVQHRLQIFQAFQIGLTPEQSNRNFFAPLVTAFDRLMEVGRVVALFLEYFHARIKPLVGIVLVVGDARTENIHQREAFVLNGTLEHFYHVFLLAAEGALHVIGTANDCHRDLIDWVFYASFWPALGFHSIH